MGFFCESKYASVCKRCSDPIKIGSSIYVLKFISKGALHEHCATPDLMRRENSAEGLAIREKIPNPPPAKDQNLLLVEENESLKRELEKMQEKVDDYFRNSKDADGLRARVRHLEDDNELLKKRNKNLENTLVELKARVSAGL